MKQKHIPGSEAHLTYFATFSAYISKANQAKRDKGFHIERSEFWKSK